MHKALLEGQPLASEDFPLLPRIGPTENADGPFVGMSLSFYWGLIRRHHWKITTFVLLATAIATLVSLSLPKQYEATAVLRIDPSGQRTAVDASNSQNSTPPSDSRLLTTEARVLTSPAVVSRTINELHLYQNQEFRPAQLASGDAALSPDQTNRVLTKVTSLIGVDQPLDTYLLRVSFRSLNPQLSAQVANSLLGSLIQHDAETRVNALMASTHSMRAQLSSLNAEMESSQEALVKYESANDVLDPDSKTNIMQSRLSQISQDLGTAQTKRMQLQADEQTIQSGNLDALAASDTGKELLPLYTRLQNDQRDLGRMSQVYGPNYPLYRQQQELVKNDEAVLQTQEQHLASQINSQYASAVGFENLLSGELNSQKQRMDVFNLKAIRYHSLQAAADSFTKLYYQLQQSIQDAEVAANLQTESLRVISAAEPDDRPVYPRPLLTAIIVFFFSSLLAVGLAIAIGSVNKTVASPDDVEHWFGARSLASLPLVTNRMRTGLTPAAYTTHLLERGSAADPDADAQAHSPFREGILTLRSAILLAREQEINSLAICSSLPGEGKSTVSANLACAFASLGRSTVLVDTDMRKSNVHRLFKVQNRRGLSSLLRAQYGLDQILVEAPGVPNLSLIPAGPSPANPGELMHRGLGDLLEQLRQRFDYVLFDCPPVLGFADALVATNLADATLLVVRAGKTERQFVAGALRQLRAARVNLLGTVLNSASQKLDSYYSYYEYGYAYHNADEEVHNDADNSAN
ncbi:MAG TPA: polysaccharide biosynthesis tyrosine autokinase [Terriglobales bacterium]|nr:polysaccharide biosynthesis tyrosine autokinase [Terriglobales bacterium]